MRNIAPPLLCTVPFKHTQTFSYDKHTVALCVSELHHHYHYHHHHGGAQYKGVKGKHTF